MAVGDLYQATLWFGQGQREWSNTIGYRQTEGTAGPNTHNAMCTAINAAMDAEIRAVLSDNCYFFRVEFHAVTGPDKVPGSLNHDNSNIGDVVGESAPQNIVAIMRLITDAPRGQANGRLLFSGLGEGQMVDGLLTAGAVTDLDTWGATIATNMAPTAPEDVVYEPVVISRVEFGEDRPVPIGFHIESVATQSIIYNQRRRKRPGRAIDSSVSPPP